MADKEYPEVDLTRGVKELCDALPQYEKAEAYYEGDVEEVFANSNIERYIGKTRNRYRLNFSKMVVNALADRIEISSVVVPTSTDLTKLINKIYKKNRMHRKSRTIHRRTTMFGDAYLFVWPENPDSPNIKFEVYYNSPKTTRVIYDREQPDKPAYAIKMWRTPSPLGRPLMVWRVNLYYPTQTEKYISNEKATSNTATSYYPTTTTTNENEPPLDLNRWDLLDTIPNPYNTIPIFHFRNDEPYGSPRHKDGYGAQDAINKLSTTLVHTADFQGFPQRYGLADPNAQIGGESNDSTPWPDQEDRALDDQDSSTESGPGTFIILRGIKAAGSFPAAPPDAFMAPARFYLRSMAQITNTPLRFFDPMGEPPSGEALRAMDAPLDKEALDFEDMLEEPWADVHEFMLKVLDKNTVPSKNNDARKDPDDPDKEVQVDIQWKPTHTIDDSMGWQTIQTKIKTGVPARQALTEAGYSEAQVTTWLNNNENRALLDHDSEILQRIALSAANLSKAVDSKVLDPNVAQHILTSLLDRLLKEKLREPKIKEEPVIVTTTPPPSLPDNGNRQGEPNVNLLDKAAQGSPPSRNATAEATRRLATLPNQ